MRTVSLPLVGGAYADESRPFSMQDTVNYLPTMAERGGTRSQAMLKTPPGLKPYQSGSEGTVRGTYEAEGRFFAVIGSMLYQVSNTGILIPRGTVPGFTRVQFTHNQISLGNEIVVVNGSAGYVYNTVDDTFARITDEGYPGSATVAFIDSMVLGIEPQGRYAFNSAPAQATQYNTLDRFTSEFKPDRLIALGVSSNELLLLSASSGEFFENTGASEQPFRSKRITMDKGAAGPHVVVSMDNTLAWLGSDGSFYMLEGYSPRRISTRPIEQAIDGLNWSQAFGFLWKDNGYEVAYWTFPDGRTWGFDAASREWHRRESDGLHRWRANTMTRWNNKWYAGDYNGPRLYEIDWEYPWEWDQEFASERTCVVMHDDQNLVKCPRLELVMDTGQPEIPAISAFPAQPVGPSISGAAPDGIVGHAYTFTYTTVAGDAAIVKTTIDETALLAGLSWNQATATISGTPTVAGTMTITPHVIDANGLWAELTDSIAIGAINWIATNGAGKFVRSIGENWQIEAAYTASGVGGDDLISGASALVCSTPSDTHYSLDKGLTWSASTGIGTSGQAATFHGAAVGDNIVMVDGFNGFNYGSGASFTNVTVPFPSCTPSCIGGTESFLVGGGSLGGVDVSFDNFATSVLHGGVVVGSTQTTAIGSNGTRVVVAGDGSYTYYTDNGSTFVQGGLNQSAGVYPNGNPTALAANGTFWVMGGSLGIDWSDDNSETWHAATIPADFYCTDVKFGAGLWVAVGYTAAHGAMIATSTDGKVWTERPSNFNASDHITSVAFMGATA